jgi:AcrR family transcriptional regulator
MHDSRRSQPPPIERILRVATTLFSVNGFRGTSTRDVARRARVNEVTVFRLFKNKEKLFIKVIESKLNGSKPLSINGSLSAAADKNSALAIMTDYMQETFDPTFLRLLLFAVLEQPRLVKKHIQPRILDFYVALDEYLTRQANNGSVRPLEPDLAARALLGMVAYHRIFHELLGAGDQTIDQHPPLGKYMDIWLHGVLREEALERKNSEIPA